MAKEHYIGVSGVARKGKKPYIGVSGVARKCKKGFVGVDSVARQFLAGVEPGTIYEFLSTTTWLCEETGLYRITCIGGGGAGGFCAYDYYDNGKGNARSCTKVSAGGGGGGAGAIRTIDVEFEGNAIYEINIGNGGSRDDESGGVTSIVRNGTTYLSANGGKIGGNASANAKTESIAGGTGGECGTPTDTVANGSNGANGGVRYGRNMTAARYPGAEGGTGGSLMLDGTSIPYGSGGKGGSVGGGNGSSSYVPSSLTSGEYGNSGYVRIVKL